MQPSSTTPRWKPKYLVMHDYGGTPRNEGGVFNPYHTLVFPDGTVRHRNPSSPYSAPAPHAYKMNPDSIGISYAGPVGSQPTPAAMSAIRNETQRIGEQFPGIQPMSHGEAFQATKGTPMQASRDGRGLDEASWRKDVVYGPPAPGQQSPTAVASLPMRSRGLTTYAGMAGGSSPLAPVAQPSSGGSNMAVISPEWERKRMALGGPVPRGMAGGVPSKEADDGMARYADSMMNQPLGTGWAALAGASGRVVGGMLAGQLRQNQMARDANDAQAWGDAATSLTRPTAAPTAAPVAPVANAPRGMAGGAQPQQAAPAESASGAGGDPRMTYIDQRINALVPQLQNQATRGFAIQQLQQLEQERLKLMDPNAALERRYREAQINNMTNGGPNADIERRYKEAQIKSLETKPSLHSVPAGGKLVDARGNVIAEGEKRSDPTTKKAIWAAQDELPNIQGAIDQLTEAKGLLGNAYHGMGSQMRSSWNRMAPDMLPNVISDPQRSADTTRLNSLLSMEAINQMSQALKGATTDREMASFTSILANPNETPENKAKVIDTLLLRANRNREITAGRIQELGGTMPNFAGGTATDAAPIKVQTPEEAMKLPPGTKFMTPDGEVRTRH